MSEMALKLIVAKSKLGHSLSQISELVGLTIDQIQTTLAQATGLDPLDISIIFHMKERGLSLEQINQETGVALEVLMQFLPQAVAEAQALADGPPPTTTEETTELQRAIWTYFEPQPSPIPTFLYCCQGFSNRLRWVHFLTGEESVHELPSYQFKDGCRWSELPEDCLLVTGESLQEM
jgi:lambda repressor-like predicted transcriptional regulator